MADQTGRPDARHRFNPAHDVIEEREPLRGRRVLRARQRQRRRGDAGRQESELDGLEPQDAPHQQPAADEQEQRERDLSGDQKIRSLIPVFRQRGAGASAFSDPLKSAFETSSAGIAANARPASSAESNANAGTNQSMRISLLRGRYAGPRLARNCVPADAIKMPRSPPPAAVIRLSVTSCRTMRNRPAPRAARTAISLRRAALRASMSVARLAHATRSSAPVAAKSRSSGVRALPTMSWWSGRHDRAPPGVRVRMGLLECAGQSLDVSPRRLELDARLQPGDDRKRPVAALRHRERFEDERNPHVSGRELEAGRDDADYGVGLAVETQ